MHLKIYNSIDTLPHSITILFEQNTSLFLERQWFKLYEHYFLRKKNSQFIVVFDSQNEAIVLLLLQGGKTHKNLIAVSNFYSAYFSPMILENLSQTTIKQAYSLIIKQYLIPYKIQSLEISPVLLKLHSNDLLIQMLRENYFIIDSSFYCANWTSNVENLNFKQYYQQRPSILKNTIKRKTNKLNKTKTHAIKIYTSPKDINLHFKEYEEIYQLSWKNSEASIEFIKDFMLNYAQSGQSRLGIASINGQTVASQFWLVHNNTALIYKLAYNPAYKEYSIGSILTAKMMEYVIDIDGVKKLDYLTGDDHYKKDWMDHRQEFSTIIAYNSHTVNGLLLGLKHFIKLILKKILRIQ